MKIVCSKQKLVEAVINVQRAVSTKSAIPALEGILLKAKNNELEMTAYNLELGINTKIEAKTDSSGEIILNAKLFSDIIKKLPDENINITLNSDSYVEIKSGLSEFSILGMDANDYPEFPVVEGNVDFKISSSILKSMIYQTLFAVAETDSKPIHTGTLFDIEDNKLNLVSIDGYRLAKRTENINYDGVLKFVVPGKTLSEVIKLIPEDDNDVFIYVNSRHIVFKIQNYNVVSRLLEGEFLNYKSTIPSSFSTEAEISVREFIESVERVSLLITDRIKSPIKCVFDDNEIKLSCSTTIGKANDELNCKMNGNTVEIGFNNRYLIDALRYTDSDKAIVKLDGPLSPMKIMPINKSDSFLFLVMPVRLRA